MAVQLALDDRGGLSEQHRHYLHQIECKCRKLAELTQQLQKAGALAVETGNAYAVVCVHCRRTILTVPDLGDAEAKVMADHLRTSHPDLI